MNQNDALKLFQDDLQTEAIILIGGTAEEEAAAYIKDHVTKPAERYFWCTSFIQDQL